MTVETIAWLLANWKNLHHYRAAQEGNKVLTLRSLTGYWTTRYPHPNRYFLSAMRPLLRVSSCIRKMLAFCSPTERQWGIIKDGLPVWNQRSSRKSRPPLPPTRIQDDSLPSTHPRFKTSPSWFKFIIYHVPALAFLPTMHEAKQRICVQLFCYL